MKKKHGLLFGFAVLMLAAMFTTTLVGCGDGAGGGDENNNNNNGGGNTAPGDDGVSKSITITGLTGTSGKEAKIFVIPDITKETETDGLEYVAFAETKISGNSVTFVLLQKDGKPWTGTGSYYLELNVEVGESWNHNFYTNGKTFAQLGITSEEDAEKLPKYNISGAVSTINFNQFQVWD